MHRQTEIVFKKFFSNGKDSATFCWSIGELYAEYKHSSNISNVRVFSPSKNDWEPLKKFTRKPVKGFIRLSTYKHPDGILFDCDRVVDTKCSLFDNGIHLRANVESYVLKDLYDEFQMNVADETAAINIPYMPTKDEMEGCDVSSTTLFWEPILKLEYKDMQHILEYSYGFEFEDDACLDFCLGPGNLILPL